MCCCEDKFRGAVQVRILVLFKWQQILQVEVYLPPTTPAFPHMTRLELVDMELTTFSSDVAAALKCLVELNLGNNSFARIPPAVSQITTLKLISLFCNPPLQLKRTDEAVIAALPSLKWLSVGKIVPYNDAGFSRTSVAVMKNIRARFPHLELPCI